MEINRQENDEVTKRVGKDGKIRRPMNAFMIWSKERRKQFSKDNPGMHNAEISRRMGREWAIMDENQRKPYIEEAKRIRSLHMAAHPEYKYKPKRKLGKLQQQQQQQQQTVLPTMVNNVATPQIPAMLPDDYWKWFYQQTQAMHIASQQTAFPSLPTPPLTNAMLPPFNMDFNNAI